MSTRHSKIGLKVVFLSIFLATSIFICPAAFAITEKEEKVLEKEAARIDTIAKTPSGQEDVIKRMTQKFNVSAESIKSMRKLNMGFGEIFIALAISRESKRI